MIFQVIGGVCNFLNYAIRQNHLKLMLSDRKQHLMALYFMALYFMALYFMSLYFIDISTSIR